MKVAQNKQTFRGEGHLFIHVVACRQLEKKETLGWQVRVSFNQSVGREFGTKTAYDRETPLFHLREYAKIKMSRD